MRKKKTIIISAVILVCVLSVCAGIIIFTSRDAEEPSSVASLVPETVTQSSAEVNTESVVPEFTSYDIYRETIENYINRRNEAWENLGYDNYIESFLYCITDINNDGVDELVINDDSLCFGDKNLLSAIYTIKNSEVVEVDFLYRAGEISVSSDGYIIQTYKGMYINKLIDGEPVEVLSVNNYHDLMAQGIDFEEYCKNFKKENGISTESMHFDFIKYPN